VNLLKIPPGSVILAPHEVALLQSYITRWEMAASTQGGDTNTPLVDIGNEIRELLNNATEA
jgi:hypothetical protein